MNKINTPIIYPWLFFAVIVYATVLYQGISAQINIFSLLHHIDKRAELTAKQTRFSLLNFMVSENNFNFDQIINVVETYESSLTEENELGIKTRIVHSKSIDHQFPNNPSLPISVEEEFSLADGLARYWERDGARWYVLPIVAGGKNGLGISSPKCGSCHQTSIGNTQIKDGYVLGLVEIQTPLSIIDALKNGIFKESLIGGFVSIAVFFVFTLVLHVNLIEAVLSKKEIKKRVDIWKQAATIRNIGDWEEDLSTNQITRSMELMNVLNLSKHRKSFTRDDFLALIHPGDHDKVRNAYIGAQKSKSYNVEFRIIKNVDSLKVVNAIGQIEFDGDGNPSKLIGLIEDITEDKKTAEKIKRNEALLIQQERLVSLGELAASISHEIFDPLHSIQLAAYNTLVNKSTLDVKATYKIVAENIEYIIKTTKLLKDLARNAPLNLEEIDLAPSIEEVSKAFTRRFNKKKITLTIEQGEACFVNADKQKLKHVFMNLLNNAESALEGGGEGNIVISISRADKSLEIRFYNDGPLIPESVIDKIFDPFFTTKPIGEGTGLGLFIVHSIITKHEGVIRVLNIEKKGVAFLISIPFIK